MEGPVTKFVEVMFRSIRVMLVFVAVLVFAEPTHAFEYWGVVGEYFYAELRPVVFYGQTYVWPESNGPAAPGLTVGIAPGTGEHGQGLKIEGIPTTAGLYTHTFNYTHVYGGGTYDLSIIVFKTPADRDVCEYYTALANGTTGLDQIYWSAVRGYFVGMGVGDEGLALYSYYVALGDYYYVSSVSSYPQWAAFYYWYYRGLGAYYYYERHGDRVTAESVFSYFVGLANESL